MFGLNVNIFSNKSQASGLAFGNRFLIGCLVLLGSDLIKSNAFSLVIYDISDDLGVPRTDIIL